MLSVIIGVINHLVVQSKKSNMSNMSNTVHIRLLRHALFCYVVIIDMLTVMGEQHRNTDNALNAKKLTVWPQDRYNWTI